MRLTTLRPAPPYDFDKMLTILGRFAHPTTDIVRDDAYWRVLRDGEGLGLLRVSGRGSADAPALDVDLVAQSGEINADSLLSTLRRALQINHDRAPFFAMARRDPALWNIVAPVYGAVVPISASVFEALATTIIEQQIAWVTAQRAQRWLVEWAGKRMAHDGAVHYAFPTARQIAKAEVPDLKPLKITNKRISLLIDVARQEQNGALDLEGLARGTPEEAYATLNQIKGIGHWTAAVTLERAVGHFGYVAYNDVALQAAANHYFFGEDGRLEQQTLIDTFARYGDFAGECAHYTILRWILDRY